MSIYNVRKVISISIIISIAYRNPSIVRSQYCIDARIEMDESPMSIQHSLYKRHSRTYTSVHFKIFDLFLVELFFLGFFSVSLSIFQRVQLRACDTFAPWAYFVTGMMY